MSILGVVNVVPNPNGAPPVEAVYQFSVPAEVVAPKVAVPESQTGVAEVEVIVGNFFMVAVTSVLGTARQFPFVAST